MSQEWDIIMSAFPGVTSYIGGATINHPVFSLFNNFRDYNSLMGDSNPVIGILEHALKRYDDIRSIFISTNNCIREEHDYISPPDEILFLWEPDLENLRDLVTNHEDPLEFYTNSHPNLKHVDINFPSYKISFKTSFRLENCDLIQRDIRGLFISNNTLVIQLVPWLHSNNTRIGKYVLPSYFIYACFFENFHKLDIFNSPESGELTSSFFWTPPPDKNKILIGSVDSSGYEKLETPINQIASKLKIPEWELLLKL